VLGNVSKAPSRSDAGASRSNIGQQKHSPPANRIWQDRSQGLQEEPINPDF